MAISKVQYDGNDLINLENDTVGTDTSRVLAPYTYHASDGTIKTGTGTSGITPTGTKSITANGTYDVTQYASAVVNVPSNYQEGTLILPSNGQALTIPVSGTVSNIFVYLDMEYSAFTGSTWGMLSAGKWGCATVRYSHSGGTYSIYGAPTSATQHVICTFANGSVTFTQQSLGFAWGYGQTAKWIAW